MARCVVDAARQARGDLAREASGSRPKQDKECVAQHERLTGIASWAHIHSAVRVDLRWACLAWRGLPPSDDVHYCTWLAGKTPLAVATRRRGRFIRLANSFVQPMRSARATWACPWIVSVRPRTSNPGSQLH